MFMVVTDYIKLFRTGADRHNDILMSFLLLVAGTKIVSVSDLSYSSFNYAIEKVIFWNIVTVFKKRFPKFQR